MNWRQGQPPLQKLLRAALGCVLGVFLFSVSAQAAGLVLVPAGSVWKYLDDGSDQGTAWRSIDYEDDGWPQGPAQLGYGDGDEATVVDFGPDEDDKFLTTYFRHVFELTDTNGLTNLTVRLLRDDGGVVYLNGVEIFRSNMPQGAINYRMRSATTVSGSGGTTFYSTNANPALLVLGRNQLAVEIHQSVTNSSDISFDLELIAGSAVAPPVVAITQPVDQASFPGPTNLVITATASDPDGTVTRVEFYSGNNKLGEDTTSPYNFVWSNAPSGSHSLYAAAQDDLGLTTKSAGVKVLIGAGHSPNEVLLPAGSVWRYLDDGSNQGTAWRQSSFNDAAWKSGPAQLGYGDGDEATRVSFGASSTAKHITTYFRTKFVVNNPGAVPALVFRLLRDDGAVVYLNGAEVYRSNMPTGTISHTTLASSSESDPDEDSFFRRVSTPTLLATGTNVLAVEIHQDTASSSDIGFDLEVLGTDYPVVTRGPWLQKGTPNAVTVRWRTDAPFPSVVRYGVSPQSLTQTATSSGSNTEHEVRLTGLTPAMTYFYSIGNSTVTLAGGEEFRFTTAPTPGTPQRTRLWVIGDSGSANVDARNVRDAYYRFNGAAPTHLWLMLGDNAYNAGEDDEYQAAMFDMYPTLLRQTVVWSTIGNHETDQSSSPASTIPYYQIFSLPKAAEAGGVASGTEDYYSFDYANIHFICLDAMTSSRAPGSAMLNWLENDLAAATQPWLVAFWHHPPYSKGSHDSDESSRLIEMRQNALPILENYGVDLVLCGHSHAYERSYFIDGHYGLSSTFSPSMMKAPGSGRPDELGAYRKDGVVQASRQGAVYVVAGSSGKISGGSLNHAAMFRSLNRLGSLVLDVEGQRMDVKFLRETGQVDDYFTILKGPELRFTTIGGTNVVAWPLTATGFVLEQASALAGTPAETSWSVIPPVNYRSNTTEFFIPTPLSASDQFFRLRQP
jgi:hypothetical protein